MRVFETWVSTSDPTEYEVTLSIPASAVPARGGSITLPELGNVSVGQAQRLHSGGAYKAEPGEVVARLRVSTAPTKYP